MGKTTIDLIIRITGGQDTGTILDALAGLELSDYHKLTDRRLIGIGRGARTIDFDSFVLGLELEIVKALSGDVESGVICLVGSSAGGRIVLHLAKFLTAAKKPIAYIGLEDAAFFPNEALNDPSNYFGRVNNVPAFPSPIIQAAKCINYYQTCGNNSELSFSQQKTLWGSSMDNKEIHGDVHGFLGVDLRERIEAWRQADADLAHAGAVGIASKENYKEMSYLLNRQWAIQQAVGGPASRGTTA